MEARSKDEPLASQRVAECRAPVRTAPLAGSGSATASTSLRSEKAKQSVSLASESGSWMAQEQEEKGGRKVSLSQRRNPARSSRNWYKLVAATEIMAYESSCC